MTPYQIESEIKKLKKRLCCIKSTLFYDALASFPATGTVDTLYVDSSTGNIYVWDGATYITTSGGGAFTLYKQNTSSVELLGAGTSLDPLTANVLEVFKQDSATIGLTGTGTEADPLIVNSLVSPIDRGIVSGGIVTWIANYTYSVSPGVYYINGVQYSSPYTEITLAAADVTNNRLDAFVLTNLNTAIAITGTPSTSPELPYINTGTQIQASFALVTANTTQPVTLQQEYIYRENAGTPIEWAATSSNAGRINVAGALTPNQGAVDIDGTGVLANDALTLTRVSTFSPLLDKTVLIFYIKSKATWNNNRVLNFQFKNGGANVGLSVPFSNNTFGFVSSQTATWQRIVIPLSEFGLTPSDVLDTLLVTATGTGGTLGFLIDDMELQGAVVINNYVGTTDNVGVFYVSKNFTGIAASTITGYTISSINSTNAGYNAQLMTARMGDMNKAYPCPWSARNAAMEAMTAGNITKAYIKVIGGSQYTTGNTLAANNGDVSGGLAATVADISFSSFTDIPSLMKNNIFYYFEENTRLTTINKSTQIYTLGYNIDGTNTAFYSGIYGNLDVFQVYGKLAGFEPRIIRLDNSRGRMDFEGRNLAIDSYFFVMTKFKEINIKCNTVYAAKRGSIIGMTNNVSEDNGDGTPASLNINIKNVYKGHDYFPYPSLHVTADYNPFFATDYSSAIRIKTHIFNVDNFYSKENALHNVMNGFISGGNRDCYNHYISLNINYLQHDIDLVDQAAQTVAGALIQPVSHGSSSSYIRQNHHVVINIKTAIVDHSLISIRAIAPTHASSFNNSVTVNVGYVIRRYKIAPLTAVGINNLFVLPYLMQTSSGIISGEKLHVTFNVDKAIAKVGNCFGNSGVTPMIYAAKTIIKGTYITEDNSPVILLQGSATDAMVLDNATLIAKGAATNTIEVDNGALAVSIYTKDTIANLGYEVGITQQGVLTIDTNIANYL